MCRLLRIVIALMGLLCPVVCVAAPPLARSVLIIDATEPNSPWGEAAFAQSNLPPDVTGTILPLRLSNLATPAKASVPNLEKSDVATLGKAHPA